MSVTTFEIALKGPGGEPVYLVCTIMSHGIADLPPATVDEEAVTYTTTLAPPSSPPRTMVISEGRPEFARVTVQGRTPRGRLLVDALTSAARQILNLDEDLSEFYALVASDPDLSWAPSGAWRPSRMPTAFEAVVKTICMTNCAWSATVRMTSALVDHLGAKSPDGRRAFPSPVAMAGASEAFYRDVARAGYRGAYLRSLAESVAEGRLDIEALDDPGLTDEGGRRSACSRCPAAGRTPRRTS